MIRAATGGTYPAAGVTAARPAIAPVRAPVALGFPSFHQFTPIHVRRPKAPPSIVFTNAYAATPFAARALPALNPNQPNQRSPAPRATNGMLWGGVASPEGRARGRGAPEEAPLVVPKPERDPNHAPPGGDDAERRAVLHHDPEDVFPADEPAIEEREADGHQHHEGGAHEHERRVAGVDRHPEP